MGQKGNCVIIDPEQLPSGELTFQLLAHDGFHTVSAVTESVTLPPKPPAVAIVDPQESSLVYAERQLHLFGVVSSFAGYTIEDDHVAWYIDEELVARGRDVWVPNPGRGVMKCGSRQTSRIAPVRPPRPLMCCPVRASLRCKRESAWKQLRAPKCRNFSAWRRLARLKSASTIRSCRSRAWSVQSPERAPSWPYAFGQGRFHQSARWVSGIGSRTDKGVAARRGRRESLCA